MYFLSQNKQNHKENTGINPAARKVKIKENIDIFKCPVCGDRMHFDDYKSIICPNKHCFDISRSGYVNLLLKPPKHKYDKEMFEARNIICSMGFFDPLIDAIVGLILNNVSDNASGSIRILDAGCGEGYHLSQIIKKLQQNQGTHLQGIGIDISKDGIQFAAKNYQSIMWCVADLAKIPFMDKKFDIVLNILSPSNYSEFSRIIGNEGVLIKVVPDSGYLKELRNALYQGTNREQYSNEKIIEHFGRNFRIMNTQKVMYNVSVNREELSHLIKMTPLSWRASDEAIRKALDGKIDRITADFTVIIGKSR